MGVDLLAAAAAGMAILAFALYYARQTTMRPSDVRIRRLAVRAAPTHQGLSWEEIRRQGPSSLPLLREALEQSAWGARIAKQIEQAGLRIRVGEFVTIRFVAAILPFTLIWAYIGGSLGFVLGLVVGGVGFMLPAMWLSAVRGRRLAQVARQMPEAVVLLANSLRAGFALQHGIDIVAKEMPSPVAEEFARLMADLNVGAAVDDAMQGLLERADIEEVNLMVTAVLIQRTSGGNLAEILETVGEAMRERERLMGEVRTMTAQQRFSGTVLTFWPLGLLALFSLINWHQTSVLFTTGVGLTLLAIGGVMQLMGYYTIRRILDIDV
ncbi:MAG TPA: type II secretion system F family protein [Dehalococcoidia bacterium]|nr:type II secretion system F family protein [Dehalococcoidia bacterium]